MNKVIRSIKNLFGTKSGASPHSKYPNDYFKCVWLSKGMYDVVAAIAHTEGISAKKAADLLVEKGLVQYLNDIKRKSTTYR